MVAVDDLIIKHARTPYDPVKRREYYLRTRQLKGRQRGSSDTHGRSGRAQARIPSSKGKSQKQLEREREADKRIRELKARLDKLREVLKKLVRQAIIRSGVDPGKLLPVEKTTRSEPKSQKRDTKPAEKKTVTEKRKAAERSREYYEENKPKGSQAKREKELKKEIKKAEERIEQVRGNLKASVDRARQQVAAKRPSATSLKPSQKGRSQNGT